MKTALLSAALCLGLAAASQAAPVTYSYTGIGPEVLTLTNGDPFAWTNLTVTETLAADPSVTDTVTLADLASGQTATSGTDFFLPSLFGDDPESIYGAKPFQVTVAYQANGQTLASTWQQDYDANGTPIPVAPPTPTVATPEPSAALCLGIGAGLLALTARRRRA